MSEKRDSRIKEMKITGDHTATRQPTADSGRQTLLELRNINFKYTSTVLKDLAFKVEHGELLAVLGPNGAGKSTLLKIIIGLLHPTTGEILIEGENLAVLPR